MNYVIHGPKGRGKTLLMTRLLLHFKKRMPNMEILTNYNLYDVPYEYISMLPRRRNDILQLMIRRLIGFDEVPQWLDARRALTNSNIDFTSVLSLTRHAHAHFICTCQELKDVDARLRRQIEWLISPERIIWNSQGEPEYIKAKFENQQDTSRPPFTRPIYVHNVLKRYDRYEILKLPEFSDNEKRGLRKGESLPA